MEKIRKNGLNVMDFQLEMGGTQFYAIGAYAPPSDRTTIDHIRDAWKHCPTGSKPILIGDLNTNLLHPRNKRDEETAKECSFMRLPDMSRHLWQPWHKRVR